jgi:hypothetical protein
MNFIKYGTCFKLNSKNARLHMHDSIYRHMYIGIIMDYNDKITITLRLFVSMHSEFNLQRFERFS